MLPRGTSKTADILQLLGNKEEKQSQKKEAINSIIQNRILHSVAEKQEKLENTDYAKYQNIQYKNIQTAVKNGAALEDLQVAFTNYNLKQCDPLILFSLFNAQFIYSDKKTMIQKCCLIEIRQLHHTYNDNPQQQDDKSKDMQELTKIFLTSGGELKTLKPHLPTDMYNNFHKQQKAVTRELRQLFG